MTAVVLTFSMRFGNVNFDRRLSSVGRANGSYPLGRRFDPYSRYKGGGKRSASCLELLYLVYRSYFLRKGVELCRIPLTMTRFIRRAAIRFFRTIITTTSIRRCRLVIRQPRRCILPTVRRRVRRTGIRIITIPTAAIPSGAAGIGDLGGSL